MKIRLLAFATAADALGTIETELDIPEGSRVADLRERLDRDHPGLAPLWPHLAVAIDGRVVSSDALLKDGAEVALLPPVSGGAGEPLQAELVDGPIDTGRVVAAVSAPGRGAVVVFLGTVRDHHAGRPVAKLAYSAYRSMAQEGLRRIVTEREASAPGRRAWSSPWPPRTAPPPTRRAAPPWSGSRRRSPSGNGSTTRTAKRCGGRRSRWWGRPLETDQLYSKISARTISSPGKSGLVKTSSRSAASSASRR